VSPSHLAFRPTRRRSGGRPTQRELQLSQGVFIKELAAYLGHSDPGFTLRTYTHLVPSSYEQARTAVDAVFSPTRSDPGRPAYGLIMI
jgi:hypothetical protein